MGIKNLFIDLLDILYSVFYLNKSKYIQEEVLFNVDKDDIKKTDEEEIKNILDFLLKNKLEFKFKVDNQYFYKVKILKNKDIFFIINLNNNDLVDFNRKVRYIFNSNLNINNFLLGIMNIDIDIDNKYSNKILDNIKDIKDIKIKNSLYQLILLKIFMKVNC